MRTSLNELKQTEDFLLDTMRPEEAVVFQAKMLIDPALQRNVRMQQKVYSVIRQYGRKKLRAEIEQVHSTLFQQPQHQSFREKIYQLFSKF
jgi:xylose isomerase